MVIQGWRKVLGIDQAKFMEQTCSQKFVRGSFEENVDIILQGSGDLYDVCTAPIHEGIQ